MEKKEYTIGRRAIYNLEAECLLIHLPAEMDDDSCSQIREEARDLMRHRKVRRLIYDFAGVQFMDSAGIGLLLNSYRWMREQGGNVCVMGVNRRMNRLLTISGIYQVIQSIS